MDHKAGFVNIVGNPNVGKSTLMNALVGEKLSIITSKAQTTRHRILGILNGNDFQVVFSDTPGILKPNYQLQKSMLRFVNTAIEDADILIYMTDILETWDKNESYIEKVNSLKIPVILLINKIDKGDKDKVEKCYEDWKNRIPRAEIFSISAKKKFNTDLVFRRIIELLPKSPPYFSKDELTDKPEKFFVSEIIREKILLNYKKEIPYSVEIEVEEFKESNDIINIRSIINVVRDSQKGIIIGHQGKSLKKVGTQARKDIEHFFGKKVYLELFVKVSKDWRNDKNQLSRFGYNN